VCLIKKHKKYQYKYLLEKISLRENLLVYQDNYDGVNDDFYNQESKRIFCLYSWLEKINKKYKF
jgi:hypothetical protein